MKDMGQSASRDALAPQINEPHQPAVSNSEQGEHLLLAAKHAAATIGAIYEWLERVEAAGGAKSLSGGAACHSMLTSLRKNADRTEKLIMTPLRDAIARAEGQS